MPNPIHSAGLWLGAALAPAAVCLGQSAAIVVDLNTAPARLIVPPFRSASAFGDSLLLLTSRHLYRCDPSVDSATPLFELPSSSDNARHLTPVGGLAHFVALASGGPAIWTTDGTTQGTRVVSPPGGFKGLPRELTPFGNLLAFRVDTNRGQVWRTDGTPDGTTLLHDAPSFTPEGYRAIGVAGASLVFTGFDDLHGEEPWVSDGTADGTWLLADLYPGSPGSLPHSFFSDAGLLWFVARDEQHGFELWCTDGTPDGTRLVKDINPGLGDSEPHNFASFGDGILFFASTDAAGRELWRSDGTGEGTVLVRDIYPGAFGSSGTVPIVLSQDPPRAVFGAHGVGLGYELWITDGTADGTDLVRDIAPGSSDGVEVYPMARGANGTAFFVGRTPEHGTELWVTGGTPETTRLVADIFPGPDGGLAASQARFLLAVGDSLYFPARPDSGPDLLYRSDATPGHAVPVFPKLPPGATADARPFLLGSSGNRVHFAHSGTPARGIYASRGSAATTVRLTTSASVEPENEATYQGFASTPDGRSYFAATNSTNGAELWTSDGTPAGTRLVSDIFPGAGSSSPRLLRTLENRVLFAATHPDIGTEPWVSDGTPSGTVPLADVAAGPASSSYAPSAAVRNGMLLSSANVLNPAVLWSTDGTPQGTSPVWSFDSLGGARLDSFASDGESAVFQAVSTSMNQIWLSDGTAEGTHMLTPPLGTLTRIRTPIRTSKGFFFVGSESNTGDELWFSDGTTSGTRLVRDIVPGTEDASIGWMGAIGDRAYFVCAVPELGQELWTSDATEAGTHPLGDLVPGIEGSYPDRFITFRGKLYFTASSPELGQEVWVTDGVPENTRVTVDIRPGPLGSVPRDLTPGRSKIYLSATNGIEGSEVWAISFPSADFDDSGTVDSADFFAFLTAFFAQESRADFDGSGTVDSADFFAFLVLFFSEP